MKAIELMTEVPDRNKRKIMYDNTIDNMQKDEKDKNISFLSQVSHGLKQPLQTIVLLKDLMSMSSLDTTTQVLLSKLDESTCLIIDMLKIFETIEDANKHAENMEAVVLGDLANELQYRMSYEKISHRVYLKYLPTQHKIITNRRLIVEAIYHIIHHIVDRMGDCRIVLGLRKKENNINLEIWYSDIKKHNGSNSNKQLSYDTTRSISFHNSDDVCMHYVIAKTILNKIHYNIGLTQNYRKTSVIKFIPMAPSNNNSSIKHGWEQGLKNGVSSERSDANRCTNLLDHNNKIYLINIDAGKAQKIRMLLEKYKYNVVLFNNYSKNYYSYNIQRAECYILDDGIDLREAKKLIHSIRKISLNSPIIMIGDKNELEGQKEFQKIGGSYYLNYSDYDEHLMNNIRAKLKYAAKFIDSSASNNNISKLSFLTARERQVLEFVINGNPSKNIAADLGVSQRTIENHRASIMRKTGTRSVASLVRFVIESNST